MNPEEPSGLFLTLVKLSLGETCVWHSRIESLISFDSVVCLLKFLSVFCFRFKWHRLYSSCYFHCSNFISDARLCSPHTCMHGLLWKSSDFLFLILPGFVCDGADAEPRGGQSLLQLHLRVPPYAPSPKLWHTGSEPLSVKAHWGAPTGRGKWQLECR